MVCARSPSVRCTNEPPRRATRLIADTKEVTIVTEGQSKAIPTTIWVVVEGGEVYVRSVRGDDGRWYRRALTNPDVLLQVGEYRVPFQAEPAPDAESIEAASRGLKRKYPKGGSLDAMLRPEVLHTTMRLVP